METELILQPYADQRSVEEILNEALSDARYDYLEIASAWVRRSGLRLIAPGIERLRRRGGKARITTGVSLKGATEQGLRCALELFDEAYIFEQPGRTFHPKVFLLKGRTSALTIVGSANGTVGGLVENWEVALAVWADVGVAADRRHVAVLENYFDRLRADKAACRPLSEELIVELARNPRYRLADEDDLVESPPRHPPNGSAPLFAATRENLRRAPRAGAAHKRNAGSPSSPALGVIPSVVLRWWKTLPKADAQRLEGSAPTNTVTLVQGGARNLIDHTTWFRSKLFQHVRRRPGASYELAAVRFDVVFHGASLGVISLPVRQTPRFEADENNRTASLHWRGALSDAIRQRDVTGDVLTIELLSDRTYRLTIDRTPVGKVIV